MRAYIYSGDSLHALLLSFIGIQLHGSTGRYGECRVLVMAGCWRGEQHAGTVEQMNTQNCVEVVEAVSIEHLAATGARRVDNLSEKTTWFIDCKSWKVKETK